MASADFTPTPTFRPAGPRSKMNAYFAMLIISLFAMMLACLFMYLELRNLGGFGTVQGRVSAIESTRATSLLASQTRDVSKGTNQCMVGIIPTFRVPPASASS
jgi:hypothetical protein